MDIFKKSLKVAQSKLGAGTATGTAKHNKLLLAEKKLALANKNAAVAVAASAAESEISDSALASLATSEIGHSYQSVTQLLTNSSNIVSELNGIEVYSIACNQLPGTVDIPPAVPGVPPSTTPVVKSEEAIRNEYVENLKFLMSFTDTDLGTRVKQQG